MVTSASVRLTIKQRNQTRGLASLFERRSGESAGDLIINLRPGDMHRDMGHHIASRGATSLHGKRIIEQRYSVHRSDDSPENINTIVHHCQIEGEKDEIQTRQITRAIKRQDRFALLFGRRVSDLKASRYDVKPKSGNRNISLGEIDPSIATLSLALFASAPDCHLHATEDDFNVCEILFKHFCITVIWSFISLPAHDSSLFQHFLSLDPKLAPTDEMRAILDRALDGFLEGEVVDQFKALREAQRAELLQVLSQQAGLAPLIAELERTNPYRFLRYGHQLPPRVPQHS